MILMLTMQKYKELIQKMFGNCTAIYDIRNANSNGNQNCQKYSDHRARNSQLRTADIFFTNKVFIQDLNYFRSILFQKCTRMKELLFFLCVKLFCVILKRLYVFSQSFVACVLLFSVFI